jgi:hypothetical protein
MKKKVDINKVLKNEQVAQFPWVGAMVDLTCKIHMVHCKVCFIIESKKELLNPKFDSLQKKCMKKESHNSSSKSLGG